MAMLFFMPHNMKKMIISSFFTLLMLISVGVVAVVASVRHVRLPHGAVLHVFATPISNQGAVIICPGGGYSYLEKWYEGYFWFPFFIFHGYTPAMLEYRMPRGDYRVPVIDASEAILMMKRNAVEWYFDRSNVGFVGFSAGGHLASTMMVTENDDVRPDFGVLLYPVISMKRELTHTDSHNQLLGKNASAELEQQFSNELHISEKTPPVFIAIARDDQAVSYQGSVMFRDAMQRKKRPVLLCLYPSGGHGFASRYSSECRGQVLEELVNWLNNR